MNKELIGRSILVSGKVQGVFYRASTADEASKLGLEGWVKNLPTGEVMIEVFGEKPDIDQLIAWCWQGSPLAKVSKVEVEEVPFRKGGLFMVLY
ncbi:acylphosphatase [Reichenbachiella carrageenanivorans]|uniref:acylphosphatase n=1 Tax=Reichenbachiella carrageenanivorans TaxID=2979869 RepID=A0ABY6CZB7_9BACT|nr:acylphosphatase [Reichenbachiella carrageenanivorans]UXX79261.1 acylphosphatase [Reichenbachiella carrageenanivorans]